MRRSGKPTDAEVKETNRIVISRIERPRTLAPCLLLPQFTLPRPLHRGDSRETKDRLRERARGPVRSAGFALLCCREDDGAARTDCRSGYRSAHHSTRSRGTTRRIPDADYTIQ